MPKLRLQETLKIGGALVPAGGNYEATEEQAREWVARGYAVEIASDDEAVVVPEKISWAAAKVLLVGEKDGEAALERYVLGAIKAGLEPSERNSLLGGLRRSKAACREKLIAALEADAKAEE